MGFFIMFILSQVIMWNLIACWTKQDPKGQREI